MGLFDTLTDAFSSKPAENAANAKKQGLTNGYNLAMPAINQGSDYLKQYFGQAAQPFNELYAKGSKGYDAYADATGANGAEGQARARSNFQTDPGYAFTRDQALDGVMRRAASTGAGLGSGNTAIALQDRAGQLASTEYGNYVNRLAPFLGAAQGAATGIAGVNTGLGSGLNTNELTKGGLGYQTEVGKGNADAEAEMAKYDASKNFWSTLMGGANVAAKAFGGAPTPKGA